MHTKPSSKMQLSAYSLIILLLLLLVRCSRANFLPLTSNPLAGTPCALANCGEGTCKVSSNSSLGYECECYSGWKNLQIGPLTFPSCIVPNCTLNFDCGAASPSPLPPPLSATPLPPFNLSDPCSFTWCADGTCMANGTDYACKCNANSANLMNFTRLPCFRECNFGIDCQDLGFGPKIPDPPSSNLAPPTSPNLAPPSASLAPPPSPSLAPPTRPSLAPPTSPSSSGSPPPSTPSGSNSDSNGSNEVLKHSRIQHGVILSLLAATLLTWI